MCHWRKLAKIDSLHLMALCIVSFVDLDGIRHSAEVEADALYEGAVLGLAALRKHDLRPGPLTQIEVEVRSSVTHQLTMDKIERWLKRAVHTPKEAVTKERLRSLWPI